MLNTKLVYSSQPGTIVPRVAKHGTEVMKEAQCFDCLNIYICERFSHSPPCEK